MDGGCVPDETDEALAAYGLTREAGGEVSGELFRVYAINWPTLAVFCSTWKQWKKTAGSDRMIRLAMDWVQVESALRLSGVKRAQWPAIFAGLREMEEEALNYLNQD